MTWTRFRLINLVVLPLILSWAAQYVQGGSTWRLSSHGLRVGQYVVVAITVVYLVFPFWFERLVATNAESFSARWKQPEVVLFKVVLACSVLPSMAAFFFCLVGGPETDVYLGSALSLGLAAYWSWRYRRVFIGP